MKTPLISILIMLSIAITSIANCRVSTRITDDLLELLDAITDEGDLDGYERFSALWEENRDYFLFSVPMSRLESADNAVIALGASIRARDSSEYARESALARRAIEEIAIYSSFDIKNIL